MMELVSAVVASAVMAGAVAEGKGGRCAHQRQKGGGENFLHARIVAWRGVGKGAAAGPASRSETGPRRGNGEAKRGRGSRTPAGIRSGVH